MLKDAMFSECRTWRYTLVRKWEHLKPMVAFIGLNPSTADETEDDPTVRRCINYARDWGYGGMFMLNIFAFRATDPRVMKAAADPIGAKNDMVLSAISKENTTIACWGVHGTFLDRDKAVMQLCPNLYCLGATKAGNPKHPLYLKKDLKPLPFNVTGE